MIARPYASYLVWTVGSIASFAGCGQSDRRIELDGGADAATENDAKTASANSPSEQIANFDSGDVWEPLPRDAIYAGQTLEMLAIAWAHWNLSQSDCVHSANTDPDGSLCGMDQKGDSPVFFVAAGMYPTVRSKCTVGVDQALLIPLDYFYADGISHPFGINTPQENLESEAEAIQETMRDRELVVDGHAVAGLELFSVGPLRFEQTLAATDNFYTCAGFEEVPTKLDPIYLVGHFALLPPPSPGTHRIEFGGTYSYVGWDYVNHVSFTFSAE